MPHFDTIVIGAGAAGLMCAIEAGKRGRRIVVLEHSGRAGNKILISGGGRCNFTNLHTTPDNFICQNPHFAKSALARYTPADFIALVEKHRIPYHEKTLGQLFCDRSAQDIMGLLETECRAAGVKIALNSRVKNVRRDTSYTVETDNAEYTAATLVIGTGGLSIPKMGATDFGYRMAKQFELHIVPARPALVPLLVKGFTELAGVSTEVVASIGKRQFREKMLFTHRGLSGPAILQISSYLPGQVSIDLLPDLDILPRLQERDGELASVLSEHLPKRLAALWPPARLSQMSSQEIERTAGELHEWRIANNGTEGFEKAEVTAGGVDTSELSSSTMEARKVPGLYFIGEVVDVTGHLGGFNFQWAWASGAAAGRSV